MRPTAKRAAAGKSISSTAARHAGAKGSAPISAFAPESATMYAISGPTASGKTALSVDLALHVGGEIVNFDSVQIYKGIEIATAKPTESEKAETQTQTIL